MRRVFLSMGLAMAFPAFAQVNWNLKLDSAQPFTVREPLQIDLAKGDVRVESLFGGVTCTCSPGPCPTPPASGTTKPHYFVVDGKWYPAMSGKVEFYRGLYVADNVSLPNCVRPGGAPPLVTLNLLLTSSGLQLIYLNETTTIQVKHGVRQADSQPIGYLEFRSSTGDLTCAGSVPSPLLGDLIYKNGFQNL